MFVHFRFHLVYWDFYFTVVFFPSGSVSLFVLFYGCSFFTPWRILNIFFFYSIIHFLRSAPPLCILNFDLQGHLLGCFLLLFSIVWSQSFMLDNFTVSSPWLTRTPCQQTTLNPWFIPLLILPQKQQPILDWFPLPFSILGTFSENYNLQKCCLLPLVGSIPGFSGLSSLPPPPPWCNT